jgi:caffeoyl-CoA O-methyltransferase
MNLQNDLDQYIEQHSSSEDPLLTKIYRETNIRMLNPRMISGHIQGLILSMLCRMIHPSLVLEIGTYTGYSAICLAKGLPEAGIVHTIEIDDELTNIAHQYFRESGYEKKIIQHTGDANKIIPSLNMQFDLIYIDGEKTEYPKYFKNTIEKLNKGGYLIADNVLWSGKVIDPNSDDDPATKAIKKFNQIIQSDTRLENVLLPLRDGLMIAWKCE